MELVTAPDPDHELQAGEFYAGAQARIVRMMIVIACLLTIAIWFKAGYRLGLGFALGCALAGVNFYWLTHAVNAFADRVTRAEGEVKPPSGAASRFVLRFCLLA